MSVRRHPLDFDILEKGTIIPIAEIVEMTGVEESDPLFSLARLRLQNRIEMEMAARGRPVTVCTRKGQIAVLTDEEAAEHNPQAFEGYWRRMKRSHGRTMNVDPTDLSDPQKRDLEHRIALQSHMLAAGTGVRRQLRLKPVERSVPGLPRPKGDTPS